MIILTILTLIVAISLQKNKIRPILFAKLTSIFLLFSAALSFNVLYIESIGSGIGIYSGFYQVSTISQSIDIFIYIIGAFILMPWFTLKDRIVSKSNLYRWETVAAPLQYIRRASVPILSEYSLIILFTSLGGSLLLSSSDLISMYLSIELQSFAVYLLASMYISSHDSTSAGLKYFLLGGLSSCFILLGCGLIYSFTGLTNLESIYSLVSVPTSFLNWNSADSLSSLALENNTAGPASGYLLGLILIVVGFLFKIAAAPLHNWAPDVYDDVPTIVTTWLTIMPKISIIIFLLELESGLGINLDSVSISFISADNSFSYFVLLKNLLLISSLLSLIIGTVVGLAQYKIKRLLAYSTISHVGFLLLALAVNTEQSLESLIFYLLQYSITNLNTFLILLVFGYTLNSFVSVNGLTYNNKSILDIKLISELKGQFVSNPLLSLSLAICLFSMAGIPPLIGFFAKQQVLYSATSSGYFFLSIVAILVSVISASYYLKIIKVIHFSSPSTLKDNPLGETSNGQSEKVYMTNTHSMTISVLTLTILLFMLNPSLLLNSTHLLAISIYNF